MTTFEVSNSEITMWKRCRRKWWLTYWLRLRPKKVDYVGPLPLGSRVHKALEIHYREGTPLLDVYRAIVAEDQSKMAAEGGLDSGKFDDEAELGRIMLEGYTEWVDGEGLDSDLEFIGIEEVLKYDFPLRRGGPITLMARSTSACSRDSPERALCWTSRQPSRSTSGTTSRTCLHS